MKKALVLLLALTVVGALFAADEKTIEQRVADLEAKKVVVPAYSGSVEFKFTEADTAKAPDLGVFATTTTGAVGSIALSVATDHVSAGATIGLVPTIAKTSAVSQKTEATAGKVAGYDWFAMAKNVVAWYNGKKTTYNADGTTTGLATVDFDAIAATTATATGIAADKFWKTSAVVEPLAASTVEEVAALKAFYFNSDTAVKNAINGILAGSTVTYKMVLSKATAATTYQAFDKDGIYKFDIAVADKTKFDKELEAINKYSEYVYGVATSDTWAASYPVSSASLKFSKLFDVVDITCEYAGKAVSVGSLVTSTKTKGDADLGLTVGLSSGVVPGVSASLLLTKYSAADSAAVSDNAYTLKDETVAAATSDFGLQLDAGYTMADIGLAVKASFGVVKLADAANTMVFSLAPSITLKDVFGLSIGGEFNMNKGMKGMGAGATVGAKIMGISPAVKFYWKDANFYGTDTLSVSGSDSITKDGTLAGEFASIDLASAAALDVGVSVDLAELMGMKLVTLSGGYQMMLIGATESGWNVGLGLDLNAVATMPIVVAASASKYGTAKGVGAFSVVYTYEKAVLTGAVSLSEDFAKIGYSLGAKVTF